MSGSSWVKRLSASPMISNSRSTVRRNHRSNSYSAKVCPAQRDRMLWPACHMSSSSFLVWLFIYDLSRGLNVRAEIGIAHGLFSYKVHTAPKKLFERFSKTKHAVGVKAFEAFPLTNHSDQQPLAIRSLEGSEIRMSDSLRGSQSSSCG